jgi:hypothetical protein
VLLALLDESLAIKAGREQRRLAEIERRRREKLEADQFARRTASPKLMRKLDAQGSGW